MDDPQARPTDRERDALTVRINEAASAGRIGIADRDIRLGNVRSAQSRTELDLMNRDLDQLDASFPTSAPVAAPAATASAPASGTPPSSPYGAFDPDAASSSLPGVSTRITGTRRSWILTAVIAGVALLLAGILGFIAFIGHLVSDSDSTPTALPPAQTGGAGPTDVDDPSVPSAAPDASSTYALNARGINGFLAAYGKKFHTTQVVQLVLYGDYAIVDVPVAGGKGRQAGWIFRKGAGWSAFGGVTAVFAGATTVDTRKLDVAALVRNIARARATLKVETPTQTYAIVRYIPRVDQAPRVDVHVANGFNESGYLATRLDGSIVRGYPFGQ